MNKKEKLLKKIHHFIYRFGIDISLVKKEEIIDAIEYNSIENANQFWASQKTKEVWDSEEYKEFYSLLLEAIAPYKLPLENKSWADVGCGSGTLLLYLKEKFTPKSITGFEVAQSAIDICQTRIPEGKFNVYNLYENPQEQFDFIFCTEVLEHLLHPETALENLQKRMHKTSYLIVTVPNGRNDTWGGHINYWSPESWKVFIENNVRGKKFQTGKIQDRALWALIYGSAH